MTVEAPRAPIADVAREKPLDPLVLLPVFTPDELVAIRQQWQQEKLLEQERLASLQQRELELKTLERTEKAQTLVDAHARGSRLNYSRTVSSREEALVLFRYGLTNFLGADANDPQEFRNKLIKVGSKEIGELRLDRTVYTYFPSLHEAIIGAFPSFDIQIFEFKTLPHGYWKTDTDKRKLQKVSKWVIERYLGIQKEDPEKFREAILALNLSKAFKNFGLRAAFNQGGADYRKISRVIIDTYPELKIMPWEFSHGANWTQNEGNVVSTSAVRWLVEKRLGIAVDDPQFREKVLAIRAKYFKDAGLGPMLAFVYGSSPFKALVAAYPQMEFHQWEFSQTHNFWAKDNYSNVRKAVWWMVEKEFGTDINTVRLRSRVLGITQRMIKRYRLSGMLSATKLSFLQALQLAYPELDLKEEEYLQHNPMRLRAKRFSTQNTEHNKDLISLDRVREEMNRLFEME